MAYSLSGERPSVAAVTLNPLRAFVRWLARARVARSQRIALERLLEYDAHHLDDLGINRADVFAALDHPPVRAGRELAALRARRSRTWPRD